MSGAANRLAVFDCDGTLVDSQGVIVAAMSAAFRSEGLAPPSARCIRDVAGRPLIEAILRLAPAAGDPERLANAYRDAYRARALAAQPHEPLFEGAGAALESLADAGWLLGIATGKGRQGLVRVLDRHGLADRFSTLQTADDGLRKPDPEMLQRAMMEAAADRKTTVMVGDTVHDMQMARRAGVVSVGVAWGYHEATDLVSAGADAVAETFAALPPLIDDLTRSPRCA